MFVFVFVSVFVSVFVFVFVFGLTLTKVSRADIIIFQSSVPFLILMSGDGVRSGSALKSPAFSKVLAESICHSDDPSNDDGS